MEQPNLNPLPKNKVEIRLLDLDIPREIVEHHVSQLKSWVSRKLDDRTAQKIFNEDLLAANFDDSKRLQINIDGRTMPYNSNLFKKYLLPYLKQWGEQFNLQIQQVLLLVSENECKAQAPHIDDNTGLDDFIVGLYTLQDGTNFRLKNEVIEGQPIQNYQFGMNTLVLFHSSKVHSGGENVSGEYNLRYHFRFRKCGLARSSSNAKEVGIVKRCKWLCGASYAIQNSLLSHERGCLMNPIGQQNAQKKLERQKERRKRQREANRD